MFLQLIPIIAGILGASFDTFLKGVIRKNSGYSPATYLFLTYVFLVIFSLPLLITHANFPRQFFPWLMLLIAIFFYVFANVCFVAALKREEISNITIVAKVSLVLTFIFGIILFKESASLSRLFGILIILLGIVIIFFEKKKIQILNIKGLILALLNGVGYSFAALFSKYALGYFPPYTYIFFVYIGLAISFFSFPNVRKESKQLFPKVKYLLPVLAFIGIFAYLTTLISIKYLDLSYAYIAISSVGTVVTIIFGIIIFKENKKLIHKFVGLSAIIVGIILLHK